MTSTKHKPVIERAARRNRYVEYIDHFRKRYGCTARQVFPLVTAIEAENKSLKEALAAAKNDAESLKDRNQELETELVTRPPLPPAAAE